MSKKRINFNKKLTSYFSQNIKLNELLSQKDKSKLKQSFNSIFKNFDSIREDGELDTDEVKNILKLFDKSNDNIISKKEIKTYCKENGLDTKLVKTFLERLNNSLLNENETTEDYWGFKSTTFDDVLIKYDATREKASAIYDIKNDKLLSANTNQAFEIVGVKTYEKSNNGEIKFEKFPKIIIKGENGQNTEIEVRITNNIDGMTSRQPEKDYMHSMTLLTNALSNLKPNVFEDLKNNVNSITLTIYRGNTAGTANWDNRDELSEYTEDIGLNVTSAMKSATSILTHEIGHTVDMEYFGWTTDDNEEQLQNFINKLKKSHEERYAYALTDPHELFAEYYSYVNDKESMHLQEDRRFFDTLENSLHNGDEYGWSKIKEILNNIKDNSIAKTQNYVNEIQKIEEYLGDYNNKKDAIPKDKIEQYEPHKFQAAFEDNLDKKFKDILNNYPIHKEIYSNGNIYKKIKIINQMRNHPKLKPLLEKFFNEFDKEIEAYENFKNLPFNKAIEAIDKKYADASPSLNKDKLDRKLTMNPDILSSNELREILIKICSEYSNDIPHSICEKYKPNSTEAITKEIVLAFRNHPLMQKYLIRQNLFYA